MTVSPKTSQMYTDQKTKQKRDVAQKTTNAHRSQTATKKGQNQPTTRQLTSQTKPQRNTLWLLVIQEHTGPVCRLRFMCEKVVVFKAMIESVFFRPLSMQVRSAKNQIIALPKLLSGVDVALTIAS